MRAERFDHVRLLDGSPVAPGAVSQLEIEAPLFRMPGPSAGHVPSHSGIAGAIERDREQGWIEIRNERELERTLRSERIDDHGSRRNRDPQELPGWSLRPFRIRLDIRVLGLAPASEEQEPGARQQKGAARSHESLPEPTHREETGSSGHPRRTASMFASWRSQWSTSTSAVIDSTSGTARGSTQGSCLPRASRMRLRPRTSTVSCGLRIVAVGLNATRKRSGSPFVIPPWTPPERLVRVPIRPRFLMNGSLCVDPVMRVPANPDPISNPLV